MRTILETDRLILRELEMSDLDFVEAMLAHPEVMHFFPRCLSRSESEAWIRRQQRRYERDGHGYWLAVGRKSREPVGQAGIVRTDVEGVEESALGYLVHRPFWRRGYAAEAAAACRDHAFDTLGTSRVVTLIRPENLPSLGVARKIGMRIERRTIYARYEHFVLSMWRADRGVSS
jgi:RimJ/RimL family protein N-acetyltransferase